MEASGGGRFLLLEHCGPSPCSLSSTEDNPNASAGSAGLPMADQGRELVPGGQPGETGPHSEEGPSASGMPCAFPHPEPLLHWFCCKKAQPILQCLNPSLPARSSFRVPTASLEPDSLVPHDCAHTICTSLGCSRCRQSVLGGTRFPTRVEKRGAERQTAVTSPCWPTLAPVNLHFKKEALSQGPGCQRSELSTRLRDPCWGCGGTPSADWTSDPPALPAPEAHDCLMTQHPSLGAHPSKPGFSLPSFRSPVWFCFITK